MDAPELSEKINKVLHKIVREVEEYSKELGRPAPGATIFQTHKSAIYNAGLDWPETEHLLRTHNLIVIRRIGKTNKKWFFPKSIDDWPTEAIDEMVLYLEED